MTDSSTVFSEIEAILDREEKSLTAAIDAAEATYADAKATAERAYDQAVTQAGNDLTDVTAPLDARMEALEAVRASVSQLEQQTDAPVPPVDPTVPSVPAPDATEQPASTPSDDGSAAAADSTPDPSTSSTSEAPSPSIEPTSTPSTEASPLPLPTTSPEAVEDTLRGIDTAQPIAVPLSTGEIKVVTAADVIAARDTTIADADLTDDQQVIRNSDLP